MWKSLLLLLIVAFSNAQPYGQFKYSHPGAFMTSAFTTSANSQGHLLTGYRPSNTIATFNFCIDKTDPAGGFAASFFPFKKEYLMYITAGCGPGNAAQILNCSGVSVIETSIPGNPKAWYALAGTYDNGCFFSTLDSLGSPINTKGYLFPYTNGFNVKTFIAESAISAGNFYLCGTHDSTVYAMKVDDTGNLLWSGYYHIGTNYFLAQGIIECPFTGDVLIIGSTNTPAIYNSATDGFLLRLNNTNGNIVSYKTYSLPNGACQQFTCIKPAYSQTAGQGYVIGGYTDSYPALPWILKIDTMGNVGWSTVIMPDTDPGASAIVDVIERPLGSTFEYYAAVKSNTSGMMVIRFDDYGIPVAAANNEFVYSSGTTFGAISSSLDFTDTGGNIALTSYGTSDWTSGGELYMVRSYFNGKSGCNETHTVVSNYYPGPNTVLNPMINRFGSVAVCNTFQLSELSSSITPSIVCTFTSVPGGYNGGVTAVNQFSEKDQTISFFPNPTDRIVSLTFSLINESDVQITIYDQNGTAVNSIVKMGLASGLYTSEIDLKSLNCESGVYLLSCRVNNELYSYKVIYTK